MLHPACAYLGREIGGKPEPSTEGECLTNRQLVVEGIALGHETNQPDKGGATTGDFDSVEHCPALAVRDLPQERGTESGFADTGRSDYRENLAARNCEGEVLQSRTGGSPPTNGEALARE